jgi:hypothetical protein
VHLMVTEMRIYGVLQSDIFAYRSRYFLYCSVFILKVSVMCTMFSVLSSFVGPDPDTNPEKIDSIYKSVKMIPDPGSSGSEMNLSETNLRN